MTTSRRVLGYVQNLHRRHTVLEVYIATVVTITLVLLIVYGYKGING